jgi:MFS transporter, AAHS family, 4-hydroxybenzoate transporter
MEIANIDLNDLIDGQILRPASILFLVVAALVLISDGFDLSAMGYVAPELVKVWHVMPRRLVAVFSAGIVGLLLGAPLLSFVGDRVGRKKAILIGLSIFGTVSLFTMGAKSLHQFAVLRFLTGVGLGGVIPNVTALVAELAPKRLRGRCVVLVTMGVAAGIALPGFVAATLVPRFGWPVLLFVGGALPLVVAMIGFFFLPESIKYLAQRGDRDMEMKRLARTLRPELAIGSATTLTSSINATPRGSPRGLFGAGLVIITPLLWIAVATNQMANFFSLTWLPTLLQSTGSSTAQAGIGGSLFSIGGLLSGVCLIFVIDRLGVIPLTALFVFGTPLIAAIGIGGLTAWQHGMIIAAAGFCVTGINLGSSAVLGTIYPTAIRATGVGWAQAAGRVGAIGAPLAGGALLALKLPMQELTLAPAVVLGVGALASIALVVLCVRRFQGVRLDEAAKIPVGESLRLEG